MRIAGAVRSLSWRSTAARSRSTFSGEFAEVTREAAGATTGFDDALPVKIGEHNEDILRDLLGYDDEHIAGLKAAGAI